uniref:C-type lectin domain-containing protein n=1 Tax=Nothobranchius furzeri TaxID=105023 RepID=A0A8C6NK02_NOTFU
MCVLLLSSNLPIIVYNLEHPRVSGKRPTSAQTASYIRRWRKIIRNDDIQKPRSNHEYFKQGWVYIQPSLYYISSTRKTWQESREDCLQREADLAVINTKEEQDFTRQFHKLTWIGLYNNTVTGEWTWVDGTPLKKRFIALSVYWGTGEPNKFEGKDEGCVEIRFFELENSWNDIPCIDRNFWICEKKYYI